jgi:SAM-dependent methyltransferase
MAKLTLKVTRLSEFTVSDEALGNNGERAVVGNTWLYWAHLSIYRFALPFARGRRVLDAGSGAGYGSAYLARHGANVLALEASDLAVSHSRQQYAGDSVTFENADLNEPLQLGDEVFDLVFSSNVFEHIANVDRLAAECARVLKPDGVLLVAVPPICSAAAMAGDMENPFHIHHIPPTAWQAKLERFFMQVRCFAHFGTGEFASKERENREIMLPPDRVTVRETDFEFLESSAKALLDKADSISAVFVCQGRRIPEGRETLEERTPASWQEPAAAARLIRERGKTTAPASQELPSALERVAAAENRAIEAEARLAGARAEIAALALRVAALESSTSWKITRPLRNIADAIRGKMIQDFSRWDVY